MLADLTPLLTETVQHLAAPTRDIFGQVTGGTYTQHAARIVWSPTTDKGTASNASEAAPAAQIWLLNHPRPIAIGDHFTLAVTGETLAVSRIERHTLPGGTLEKVNLKCLP